MKQTIGYIKYDYMLVKSGMWTFLIIFGILSGAFVKIKSPLFAIGYTLFGGLIFSGTTFSRIPQTVSFTALMPGGALQKVLGRYLWTLVCVGFSLLMGVAVTCMMRWTGIPLEKAEFPAVLMMFGVALFFLAFQNALLYLLVPLMGIQVLNLIRMVPGFILFFGVMQLGDSLFWNWLMENEMLFGLVLLGVGAVSMILSIAISWLVVRNRDNE